MDCDSAASKLFKILGAGVWNAWLSRLQLVEMTPDSVMLTAGNAFTVQRNQDNYSDFISKIACKNVAIKERGYKDECNRQT